MRLRRIASLSTAAGLLLLAGCELFKATEPHATVLVVNQTGVLLPSVTLTYDLDGSVEGTISSSNLAPGGTATFTGVPDGPCSATGCVGATCYTATGFAPSGGSVTLTLTPTSQSR